MKAELEQLIRNLREELTQYGELLDLLEKQQDLIITGSAEGLLENLGTINLQVPIVAHVRETRDQSRRALATILGQPTTVPFSQLVSLIPPQYRPLLEALVDEVNDLLARSQQRLRQNHLLLSRSLNQMQQMISSLFPSIASRTYTENGTVKSPSLPASALCEVIV